MTEYTCDSFRFFNLFPVYFGGKGTVANAYNQLGKDERYQFRRLVRSFVKWYNYISQIVRMFDKDLHKEYLFCSYLAKLIPAEPATPWDLGEPSPIGVLPIGETF